MTKETTATSLRMDHRRRSKNSPCIECNSQIFCSYVLALFSSALIVGGAYLAFKKWDHTWLILSIAGLTLMLIGSCMYYCGNLSIAESYVSDDDNEVCFDRSKRRKRGQKSRNGGYSSSHLMAGDRPLSDSRSVSQLSLNMIPQYFSALDTAASTNNVPMQTSISQSMSYSQIFSVNGQSFLILPISGDSNGGENCIQMQNMFFKVANNDALSGKADEETTANEQHKKTSPLKAASTNESCSQPKINKRINNESNNCNRSDSRSRRQATNVQITSSASNVITTTQSDSITPACGSTSFWIPVNTGEEHNESAAGVGDHNSVLPQISRSPRRSGTFRKRNGATGVDNQHSPPQRIEVNCNDNRDQRRLSFMVATQNEVSLTSQTSENTPLISNQDSIQTFQSTSDDNFRGSEECRIDTPSSSAFDDVSRGVDPCARIRNEASTEKTSTPPPSYDEVLSVDLQEDEDTAVSTEVLIFGTV